MRLTVFCLLMVVLFVPVTTAGTRDPVPEALKLLDAELKLARTPEVYFIISLGDSRVLIKSRGMVLRELSADFVNMWGAPPAAAPLRLLKKSTFIPPKRTKLKPGAEAPKDSFQIDALELRDMPSRYALTFEQGITISVRPKPEGVIQYLCNAAGATAWAVARPFYVLAHAVQGKTFTSITIMMKKQDAQALYWSLAENSRAVISPP